jgi:hypothetical protein
VVGVIGQVVAPAPSAQVSVVAVRRIVVKAGHCQHDNDGLWAFLAVCLFNFTGYLARLAVSQALHAGPRKTLASCVTWPVAAFRLEDPNTATIRRPGTHRVLRAAAAQMLTPPANAPQDALAKLRPLYRVQGLVFGLDGHYVALLNAIAMIFPGGMHPWSIR